MSEPTLLENHGEDGDKDSLSQRLVGEQTSIIVQSEQEVILESSGLILRELCSRSVDFKHVLCLDLEELKLYNLAILWGSSDVGEHL